jgi:hypothetical protein
VDERTNYAAVARNFLRENNNTALFFLNAIAQKLSHASHPSTIGQRTAGADRSKANQNLKWTRSALIVMKNDEAFSANKATPSQCKTNMSSLKWLRA